MSDETQDVEDLETVTDEDQPEEENDGQEAETEGQDNTDEGDEGEEQDDDGGLVVSFGDDDDDAEEPEDTGAAPKWVKELRKKHRETQRELREARAKLEAQQRPEAAPKLPPKPTLRDMDYDDAKFEAALIEWHEKKREHDARARTEQEKAEAQKQAYNQRLSAYNAAKAEMGARDFDDAEGTVSDMLNATQQGIIISGAENPAHVVYALGRRPDQAKRLAEIDDPIQFAFAVAKMEARLKVAPRKAKASPEKKISGTGRSSGAVSDTLERLRAEAMKTGDMSKVMAYKRQQKAQQG